MQKTLPMLFIFALCAALTVPSVAQKGDKDLRALSPLETQVLGQNRDR